MPRDTTSVFHLAAVVSGGAEADFDLGYRVNLDGTRALLEACRKLASPPKMVYASSVAAFGGTLPEVLDDSTTPTPQTSYGTQKVIGEYLVADWTAKGMIDGRSLRLPTIVVRPGKPNLAASSFASGIIREPLNGVVAECPVPDTTGVWILSPKRVVEAFIHAHDLPASAWPSSRVVNLPGITLCGARDDRRHGRVAGTRAVARVKFVARCAHPGDREDLAGALPHRARAGDGLQGRRRISTRRCATTSRARAQGPGVMSPGRGNRAWPGPFPDALLRHPGLQRGEIPPGDAAIDPRGARATAGIDTRSWSRTTHRATRPPASPSRAERGSCTFPHRQIAKTRNAGRARRGRRAPHVRRRRHARERGRGASRLAALDAGAVGGGASARFDDGRTALRARDARAGRRHDALAQPRRRLLRLLPARTPSKAAGGWDERHFAGEEIMLSLALRRLGRFVMLRESVVTSPRKFTSRSFGEAMWISTKLLLGGMGAVRRRETTQFWYDGRR
jgi:nucleoside-diphosphate-sugar epimerase